jgi:hypothetical protein
MKQCDNDKKKVKQHDNINYEDLMKAPFYANCSKHDGKYKVNHNKTVR